METTELSDNLRELAERAVACPNWRWMDGMSVLIGEGVSKRCVMVSGKGWPMYRDGYGSTEAAALVAALEATGEQK